MGSCPPFRPFLARRGGPDHPGPKEILQADLMRALGAGQRDWTGPAAGAGARPSLGRSGLDRGQARPLPGEFGRFFGVL